MKRNPVNGRWGDRSYLFIAILGTALQFGLFKWLYPFPDFFADSYTYIDAALHQSVTSFRPPGYALYLWISFNLKAEDFVMVLVQYLLLQGALLYFFIRCVISTGCDVRGGMYFFVFLLFNPITLYLSNYISSDALFTGLSIWWFTKLLWVVYRPSPRQIITQALLLLVVLSVRYQALCYPFIAAIGFLIARAPLGWKLLGMGCTVLFTYGYVRLMTNVTYHDTGTRVFSGFSGWQLANNALHIFPHVPVDGKQPPEKFRELHGSVQEFFRSHPGAPFNDTHAGYLWDRSSPLKQYLYQYVDAGKASTYFNGWVAVSPLYTDYGRWLIQEHPGAFLRYYLLPNTKTYLLPALESMRAYNETKDSVDKAAVAIFGYSSQRVRAASFEGQRYLFAPFPWLNLVLHVGFVILAILHLRRRRTAFHKGLFLVLGFTLINAAFSIFATPNVLRYLVFPMMVLFAFTLLSVSAFVHKVERDAG